MTGQMQTMTADGAAETLGTCRGERKRRSEAEIAALIKELERTGSFRVLRKLMPLPLHRGGKNDGLRCAIIVDSETTGVVLPGTEPAGTVPSEIVSLGMVAIAYNPADGEIMGSIGRFHAYREPSHPIPPVATRIHGITDDDVRGCSISSCDLADFIAHSARSVQADVVFGSRDEERLPLIVAHNAKFDRRMLEYHFPDVVADLPWACSQSQLAWLDYGYEGQKLFYLGVHAGFYYEARHSALADADAVVELLRQPLGGRAAMARLHDAARQNTNHLSVSTRYDPIIIAALKARAYRWNAGGAGQPKAWVWEGSEDDLAVELEFLRQAGFDEVRTVTRLDCFDRFSRRA